MKTTTKLSFMMLAEWFIWSAWFASLWLRLSKSGFSTGEIGWSYACTAIAAILSPILVGSIIDHFLSAQKVPAVLMFAGAVLMYFAAQQTTFAGFFPSLPAYSPTYMPTIAPTNSIAFANVPDVEHDFPRIRAMGTIGWIASGLACGFLPQMLGYADISSTNIPLLIIAGGSALLGVSAFLLLGTSPKSTGKIGIKAMLGLDALILLRDKNSLVFLFCSLLFAMPLMLYYIFVNGYLTEVGMKNATGWITSGQFSEISFMLALPFSAKHFGIKKVLSLGLVTAATRYGSSIYGSAGEYFIYALLFLGTLLHGIGYGSCYVTAYIYVNKKALVYVCAAAQGLITLCRQGFGSLLGYRLGGVMMEKMFAYQEPVNGLTPNWAGIRTFGTMIIAIIAVLFMTFFREPNNEATAIKVDDRDIVLTQGEVK